ncbi:5315_t:CDS:2 [Paraglomus occultum]|uniref:5315_t:CDS:1 n=1 Tax=Paraglomus occultum TaxID=144539 RepID=A0A9N8VVL9_9GLOM|nr:5315_t:CDS:2 [Paraglomus occultum]
MSILWSPKEDQTLVRLGNRGYGRRMRAICLKHKTAKQCADRWNNIQRYVNRPFTPFERNMIRHLYRKYGPRWRRMAAELHHSPQTIMECWQVMDEEAARIRRRMAVQRLLS